MGFKFFLIPVRDNSAVESELNAFLCGHRILSVDRRWVDLGHDSFWSLCVDYLDGDQPTGDNGRNRSRTKDYKEVLSPDDFSVFVKLRELRKEIAQAEAIPVYAVFTNEQLAKMVETRVKSTSDLEAIAGVGDARIGKYGDRFLTCLQTCWTRSDETDGTAL